MNKIGFFIIIIVIFAGIMLFQKGIDKVKEEPLQSTIDTGKSIVGAGKDVIVKFTSDTPENTSELINLGNVPCDTDEECDRIIECADDGCVCTDGECYQDG